MKISPQSTTRPCSWHRRRPFVLCTSYVVLLVLLAGCGFTSDTAATVGGERITRGELRAAEANYSTLDDLIDARLIEAEARARKITVSEDEIKARIDEDMAGVAQGMQENRAGARDTLAVNTARQLRPLVNARGGAALPDTDLIATVRAQLDTLQQALDARAATIAHDVPERLIKDQAIGLTNALSGKGVFVPPAELEPMISALVGQLTMRENAIAPADRFGQLIATGAYRAELQGVQLRQELTGSDYRRYVRQQLLVQKLRPFWYQGQIEALTLQILATDSQARAQEAVQKGRAGTSYEELVKTYALPGAPTPQPVNLATVALNPRIRSTFPAIQEGAYSEPFPSGGQYGVVRIAKIERRAPNPNEENALILDWLRGLRAKYPVTISEAATPPDQRPRQ